MDLKRWHWRWVAIAGLLAATGCSMVRTAPPEPAMASNGVDPQAQLSLAKLSERHGEAGQAAELYQSILRENPQSLEAHHRLAVIAAQDQKVELAAQHFEQALACGKPNAELLNDHAYFYYLQHDLDKAENSARQAIALEPQNKSARNNLALILGDKGQFDASLAEFRKVVDEAEAQANLAYVKAMAGDLAGAEKTYHHALEMNSTLRPAANALLELNDQRRGVVRDVAPELSPVGPRSDDRLASASDQVAAQTQQSPTAPGFAAVQGPLANPNATAEYQASLRSNAQAIAPWGAFAQPQTVVQQASASQPLVPTPQGGNTSGQPLGGTPQNNAPWTQSTR
jgi:Flp pilus assembly protein TadD